MCANYKPTKYRWIRDHFGIVTHENDLFPIDTPTTNLRPHMKGPIVFDHEGRRRMELANFGITPRDYLPEGRKSLATFNARTETVGSKPSFSQSWKAGRLCLIPADYFTEPRYTADDSSFEWWNISLASGEPACIAGLWKAWHAKDGGVTYGMTMLTVNCDDHPLLRLFHRNFDKKTGAPEEKRSVVIIRESQFDEWLMCRDPEQARSFFSLLPADELHAEAASVIAEKAQDVSQSHQAEAADPSK